MPDTATVKQISGPRIDLEARVAEHPFVHGLSDHHVQLSADCALAIRFKMHKKTLPAAFVGALLTTLWLEFRVKTNE